MAMMQIQSRPCDVWRNGQCEFTYQPGHEQELYAETKKLLAIEHAAPMDVPAIQVKQAKASVLRSVPTKTR